MVKRVKFTNQEEPDRLSSLSDDVLHRVLSFLDTRLAVQTCVLSKRWRHVWTTSPFLTFDVHGQLFPYAHAGIIKFFEHVLMNRDQDSHVLCFKLFAVYPYSPCVVRRLIGYTIAHNVEELDVDLEFHRYQPFKLSLFSSDTIKKLKLRMPLDFGEIMVGWNREWVLPVLKTLHLICPPQISYCHLPGSCLLCLPTLTTLCLEGFELPESLASISFPVLTTLRLKRCTLPETVWNFPALLSLELDDVPLRDNMTDYFSALVNVRDVTLYFTKKYIQDCIISCPQLVRVKIGTRLLTSFNLNREIMVVAPKLRELCCIGILMVTVNVHELENVSIKLWDTDVLNNMTPEQKKSHFRRLVPMLSKLGGAKILTLDASIVKALSSVPFFYERVPSPFKNLNYVKLPQGCQASSISTTLKKYLLGGNPRATIVTTLPQRDVNHQVVPNSLTLQKVHVDTVEKRVQVEHLVEQSVDADKVRQVGCPVAGTGTGNDWASSSSGNSDFRLWQGYEVNLEFVGLLDLITKKYPETFEHFTAKSKRFYTLKLNMLCTVVKDFLRTSMTDFTTEIITWYRDLFLDLQKWGFNVNWLVSHLNYIEQLHFSKGLHATNPHIDDRNKLLDLHVFCLERMT